MDTKNVPETMSSDHCFGLHPFVEAHPEAVFIKRTHVPVQTDVEAKKREGVELARELFTLRDTPGIPPSHRMAIKPNQGITDYDFVEGMIEGIKEVGFSADRIHVREGNWLGDGYARFEKVITPYQRIEERTGVHFTDFPSGRRMEQLTFDTLEEGSEVTWMDCPDGVVFRRIGYVAPFNQPDAWLLNIAKFHPHGMGLTLCCKNLQGTCIRPYIHFCQDVDRIKEHPKHILKDFQPDVEEHVKDRELNNFLLVSRKAREGAKDFTGWVWFSLRPLRLCERIKASFR